MKKWKYYIVYECFDRILEEYIRYYEFVDLDKKINEEFINKWTNEHNDTIESYSQFKIINWKFLEVLDSDKIYTDSKQIKKLEDTIPDSIVDKFFYKATGLKSFDGKMSLNDFKRCLMTFYNMKVCEVNFSNFLK